MTIINELTIIMKKLIFAVTAMLICAFSVNAQLLWKVTGKGDKTSYLFGTHHVAPADFLDKQTTLKEALAGADVVYGEVVMSEMSSPQTQQAMIGYMMAPADSTLSKVYTPEELQKINALLQKYAGPMVNVSQMEAMKPSIISTTFSVIISQMAFPEFDASQQLDTNIQKIAVAEGKEVKGLETIDEQLVVLFGNSIADQAKSVLELVDNESTMVERAQTLAKSYIDGDLEVLNSMLTEEDGEEEMNRLIYNRNVNWVEQLSEILPNKNIVVAVGAGHLPGEKGLINLLRQKGYTVEAVK